MKVFAALEDKLGNGKGTSKLFVCNWIAEKNMPTIAIFSPFHVQFEHHI